MEYTILTSCRYTISPFSQTNQTLNKRTYEKLCELIICVKNDEYYSAEYMKNVCIETCKQNLDFFDNGDIVMFRALTSQKHSDGIITNVPHVTKEPLSPVLKYLAQELNESYQKIVNLKEHLEEL